MRETISKLTEDIDSLKSLNPNKIEDAGRNLMSVVKVAFFGPIITGSIYAIELNSILDSEFDYMWKYTPLSVTIVSVLFWYFLWSAGRNLADCRVLPDDVNEEVQQTKVPWVTDDDVEAK